MRHHPLLWLGGASLMAYLALAYLGPMYDQGGVRTAGFVLAYGLSLPFRWIDLALRSLWDGAPDRFHFGLTLLVGVAIIITADRLLVAVSRR